ncbi:MAG: sigma-54 dependent transcriptional regulator [Candidatus Eisenbacteria bacterium]|jgi:DNA-binding NtrC family response regulator|nr:sigma-54 dependent transcriptional regulator [Candidatus Eisenbacteria bacterium]
MNKSAQILIADDDPDVTSSLALVLRQAGHRPQTVSSPAEAIEALEAADYDLVIQDMNYSRSTSGQEGLELLQRIKGRWPHVPVVLISAWGTVELAVRGVKSGAVDFITKPWTQEQISHVVRTALGMADLRRHGPARGPLSRAALEERHDFGSLIGEDQGLLRVLDIVAKVSETDVPVLITGESGTGKELVAEAIWTNSSRRNKPFVKVNLGGIPPTLFESEIFGHVRGAFTDAKHTRLGRFEAANGGTLFLDEIGDIDPSCQVKLLRVLQDRTFERVGSSVSTSVDVRVVSATNRDLATMIASGGFREDLLFRLNLITIHMPPLRERKSDIPLLAARFLPQAASLYRKGDLRLAPDALDWLVAQRWPGNVRQLKHVIERTVLLSSAEEITVHDLLAAGQAEFGIPTADAAGLGDGMTLQDMERAMILRAMDECDGNLSKVAEALGLSRGALYRRLEKHGIHAPQ